VDHQRQGMERAHRADCQRVCSARAPGLAIGQVVMRHEIDSYCVEELQPPDGKLHQAMSQCADQVAVKLERDIDGRFDKIETGLAEDRDGNRNRESVNEPGSTPRSSTC
jgi:hypothetical protein